ncbi:unnamed protein product [Fraxinus pennsylvanica]|uniref:Protein kinase domain-containing protein n=1 Tax=Fraxinus pennsylvanica TaxID=56036 RepID=A0AAD2A8X2_9LAMI|nr:unnamed protein product [Fraxinus pennsylvanica]
MDRIKAKGKKLAVTNQNDPRSAEEEKTRVQKRRDRPQKLLNDDREMMSITLGTGNKTCTDDVYCFGKVLLELVTGKLGISASGDANLDLLQSTLLQINIYDKEPVINIVDPSVIIDEDLLEEVWAVAIVAKSYLNPNP